MTSLAIDVGAKRTGVAIAEGNLMALPLTTLSGQIEHQVLELSTILKERTVSTLVIGQPRGDEHGPHLEKFVRLLASKLAADAYLVEMIFLDETLTTKEAERRLGRQGGGRKKVDTDSLAATILLEDYLAVVRDGVDYAE